MGKKKKFIDKRTALNFEVVHRDQRDPLTADETAPKMLLKEVDLRQKKRVQFEDEDPDERRRREYAAMKAALRNDDYELGAYAFPSDGYDYGQHLREAGGGHFVAAPLPKEKKQPGMVLLEEEGAEAEEAPVVMLPSVMFGSEQELAAPVGALRNKPEYHGIDLSVDPEILAALDGDGGFDEILDDFVVTAQGDEPEEHDGDVFELTDCFGNKLALRGDEFDSEECSDISGEAYSSDEDDCRTEFTMTTSRRERGEQGRILDERFEQFVKDEYDDDEMGELEEEETMLGEEATLDNSVLAGALDEYLESCGEIDMATVGMDKPYKPLPASELQRLEESNNTEQAIKLGGKEPERQQEEWDCETIVSTYSNLYNHPKSLDAPGIKISAKTGLALGYLPDKYNKRAAAKEQQQLEEEDDEEEPEDEERVNLGVKRRGESKEEKKARKAALKEEKKARRVEKKELKTEFKKESELQKKEAIARGPKLRIKPL